MRARPAVICAVAVVLVALAAQAASGAPSDGLLGSYSRAVGLPVALTRVDPRPDFDWRHTAPARGLPAHSFVVRWAGALVPPRTASWRLTVRVRGRAVAALGVGKRVLTAKAGGGARLAQGSTRAVRLIRGRRYPVEITFDAPAHDGGSISVLWSRGGGRARVIPSTALRLAAAASAPMAPVTTAPSATTPTPTSTTPTSATPTPTPPTPAVHPPFGGNINGNADYSPDFMFADAMLSAGSFYALNGDANGLDLNTPATVDVNGWPTEDFGLYVNEQAPQPGTYTVSGVADAEPTVALSLTNGSVGTMSWNAATGAFSVPVEVDAQPGSPDGGGSGQFVLMFTGTDGGVRDIHIIRPGYDATDPPVFTTGFLNEVEANDPTVLRAMDLASTNANVVSQWSQRTLPDQPQDLLQTAAVPWDDDSSPTTLSTPKGIAWQYIIDLANRPTRASGSTFQCSPTTTTSRSWRS
jgi:hypothetical protein